MPDINNEINSPWHDLPKPKETKLNRDTLYEGDILEEVSIDETRQNPNLLDVEKITSEVKDYGDLDLGKLRDLGDFFEDVLTNSNKVDSTDVMRDIRLSQVSMESLVKFNDDIYDNYTPINEGSYVRLISVMHNMNYGPLDEEELQKDFVKKEPIETITKVEDLKSDFDENEIDLYNIVEEVDTTDIIPTDQPTVEDLEVEDLELSEEPEIEVESVDLSSLIKQSTTLSDLNLEDIDVKEEEPEVEEIKNEELEEMDFADEDEDSVYKVEKLNLTNTVKDGTEVN